MLVWKGWLGSVGKCRDQGSSQSNDPGLLFSSGTQLSQAIVHQYYHPPNILELFGSILPLDLEDIFKKRKTRYHKRTSSAVWNSPPLKATVVSRSGD